MNISDMIISPKPVTPSTVIAESSVNKSFRHEIHK